MNSLTPDGAMNVARAKSVSLAGFCACNVCARNHELPTANTQHKVNNLHPRNSAQCSLPPAAVDCAGRVASAVQSPVNRFSAP